jgi:hypothetical protein
MHVLMFWTHLNMFIVFFLTSPIHHAGILKIHLSLPTPRKRIIGVEVELHPFFVMATDGRERSASCRRRF